MIDPAAFLNALKESGVDFFCGVPDSLLKEFLLVLSRDPGHHVTANEGAAIALACGYQMASSKLPLVYMQNSGLGNAVNPLMSLVHKDVYSVPMLLLVGHRGEPGNHDEPQHLPMGQATLAMLELMSVPVFKLPADSALDVVADAAAKAHETSAPVAIVVSAATFSAASKAPVGAPQSSFKRAEAIRCLLASLPDAVYVATTGFTGRELMEERKDLGAGADARVDFLNAGAMGHVSQIALGLSLGGSKRTVVVLDGDGSVLMHMGSLATIGSAVPGNFLHVLLNNGVHESVGGQALCGAVDFCAVARACGYSKAVCVDSAERLKAELAKLDLQSLKGPCLLEVKLAPGVRDKLGRPSDDFVGLKEQFSQQL
jgi:phosphonopyruvate decarboxylase